MTEQEDKPKKAKMEPAESRITFARANDLKKLLKQLEKLTPDSITALTDVLSDPEADPKLKVDVAKTLIQTRISVSEAICKDQLGRSLAEARLYMSQQPKQIKQVEEEGEETPRAIFSPSTILSIEKVTSL